MGRLAHERQVDGMLKLPIPKRKVGIVRLEMVKEAHSLYGMSRFREASEAVRMVKPLFVRADREMMTVMSLSTALVPLAMEIVAVGTISQCIMDVRDIFKHALLNNATYVICFHNHPSGCPEPSAEDHRVTKQIAGAGELLGIRLIDHIIIGEADSDFYSFRENELLDLSVG